MKKAFIKCSRCGKDITDKSKICVSCFTEIDEIKGLVGKGEVRISKDLAREFVEWAKWGPFRDTGQGICDKLVREFIEQLKTETVEDKERD